MILILISWLQAMGQLSWFHALNFNYYAVYFSMLLN